MVADGGAALIGKKFAENPNLCKLFVFQGLSGAVFTKKFAENPNLCKLFAARGQPTPGTQPSAAPTRKKLSKSLKLVALCLLAALRIDSVSNATEYNRRKMADLIL